LVSSAESKPKVTWGQTPSKILSLFSIPPFEASLWLHELGCHNFFHIPHPVVQLRNLDGEFYVLGDGAHVFDLVETLGRAFGRYHCVVGGNCCVFEDSPILVPEERDIEHRFSHGACFCNRNGKEFIISFVCLFLNLRT
jgi:hypothetical protein